MCKNLYKTAISIDDFYLELSREESCRVLESHFIRIIAFSLALALILRDVQTETVIGNKELPVRGLVWTLSTHCKATLMLILFPATPEVPKQSPLAFVTY